ncbi:MAG: putative 3-methyladenine DNA glycosylase [Chlamydiae bacterium]|nr:putative 3-methyladenine DNA glycosylase [Chlamydiota bacterium]
MTKKLPLSYFQNEDTLFLSKDLLGKFLMTELNDHGVTGGMIVETEAYMAPDDKASHAYNHRRTDRTEMMYQSGGVAYVYLCYGMHHLFNIITHKLDTPHAILIRALEPTDGIDAMLKRCQKSKKSPRLTSGPALLTKALGIKNTHTGVNLTEDQIWIEDRGMTIPDDQIVRSPRVGIDYAEEYATEHWRFTIKNHPSVSRKTK